MLVTFPSPISELQHAPLSLEVLRAKERAPIPYFSTVFSLDLHLSPLRSLGVRQYSKLIPKLFQRTLFKTQVIPCTLQIFQAKDCKTTNLQLIKTNHLFVKFNLLVNFSKKFNCLT